VPHLGEGCSLSSFCLTCVVVIILNDTFQNLSLLEFTWDVLACGVRGKSLTSAQKCRQGPTRFADVYSMPKPQKKTATAIKTNTKSNGHTTKQGPKKTQSQTTHGARKRKTNDSTDCDESSSPEPICPPHRKRTKKSVVDEVEAVDSGPEVVLDIASSSDRDDARSSDREVRCWAHSAV